MTFRGGVAVINLAEMGRSMLRPYKGEMQDQRQEKPKPRNMLRHYKGEKQRRMLLGFFRWWGWGGGEGEGAG